MLDAGLRRIIINSKIKPETGGPICQIGQNPDIRIAVNIV